MAVYGSPLGESNGAVRALGSNVFLWLLADIGCATLQGLLPARKQTLVHISHAAA